MQNPNYNITATQNVKNRTGISKSQDQIDLTRVHDNGRTSKA